MNSAFYISLACSLLLCIRAAIDFLSTRPDIDTNRLGAFGLSSGGTAILEAGVVEPRLKTLIALDATVL